MTLKISRETTPQRRQEMLIEKMESTLRVLMKNGKTKEEATALLLSIEPFDKYPQYIENIIEKL